MSIALILPERDVEDLTAALATLAPGVSVQVWPQIPDPDAVRLAVVWYPPPGSLTGLSGLTAVLNFGAGVDGLIDNPEVPPQVQVGRLLLDSLRQQMTTYCLAVMLPQLRELQRYRDCQAQRRWAPRRPPPAVIGLLGNGYLGSHLGRFLAGLGFPVMAWSRSARQASKDAEGLECVHGEDGLSRLLERSACVVCLLPLTADTRGILNEDLFARMQPGSHLINVARGGHLVEADLLAALDAGRPGRATLDVLETEPLPDDHPFWRHPGITVTPHIASLTIPLEAAGAVVRNYRRISSGHGVDYPVNRDTGY